MVTIRYLLGVDLGTSSVKCALIDANTFAVMAHATHEYELYYPQEGFVEQRPDEWWSATVSAVGSFSLTHREAIVGIGFSGQMHGTVLLDTAGKVLHPAIIWADQRSKSVLDAIESSVGADDYVRLTGTAPASGFMVSTLAWFAEHQPEMLGQAAHVLLPKDYIRYRMTGALHTDVSDAAGTGVLDIRKGVWASDVLDGLGIPQSILPEVVPAYEVVGELHSEAAAAMGLQAGIPVVAGCADQPAQAIGNGIWGADRASITLGSGGQVFMPIHPDETQWTTDARVHVFNHAAPGWYVLGAMLSAGLALRWLRDLLGAEDYASLNALAHEMEAGSEGLLFLPYLNGERTPHMNPDARGAFVGLTGRHTRGHMVRAVMEGVAFALRQTLTLAASVSGRDDYVLVGAGGGMADPLWRQIVVDVLGRPVVQSARDEAAASGGALLAGIGSGLYGTPTEAFEMLHARVFSTGQVTEPDLAAHERYSALYARWCEVYPALH